ncbi:hypothetical protein AB1Y20_006780 [Prymnesium parvum]|uniref:Sulfotransferase domain-containing protein n=1 Tax=Prymnesium parvum TaxID=97485 RepID=A0AB34J1N0_PRYPA
MLWVAAWCAAAADSAALASLASGDRCGEATDLCARVHALEPTLPIAPAFLPAYRTPCLTIGGTPVCLPAVHVISGWHMLDEAALGFLKQVPQLERRSGSCFDDWPNDGGAARWVSSWGGPLAGGKDALLMTHCNKLLSWYPAFAGRYLSAWGATYGPCKLRELAKGKADEAAYYRKAMWEVCRPAALAAHDAAVGSGGSGREATPPFVMKALYGAHVRIISALRNPVDRLEISFWEHSHYMRNYGASAEGLHKYVVEQTAAFETCAVAHGTRRCAQLFELISKEYADVFFHCDQIIRGLYEPFVRDWHAAFGAGALLLISVESLVDAAESSRKIVLDFLGLPSSAATVLTPHTKSYMQLHEDSLRKANAESMLPSTRALAEKFYRPHNLALAKLVGVPGLEWPNSTVIAGLIRK